MAPASSCLEGSAGGSEQPQVANLRQQHASAQHMNITSLAFEATACLWELLADVSSVGEALEPASWLGSSYTYLCQSCSDMLEMMKKYSAAWRTQQDTLPAESAQLQAGSGQSGVQRGRQLSSLMPAVSWDRLRSAAISIGGSGDQQFAVQLLNVFESFCYQARAGQFIYIWD
jgi:hypothetical protein